MITCHKSETTACECSGPEPGKRTFWCHRHQRKKTRRLRELCRTRPDYFRLWEEGRRPGQKVPSKRRTRPPEEMYPQRMKAALATATAAIRRQILSRRQGWNAPGLTFDQCAGLMFARPWAQIAETLKFCVRRCVHFGPGGCEWHGTSCQDRTRWRERIARQRCKVEEEYQKMARREPTRFLTLDDLRADTLRLLGRLPPTISRVVGIARSGIIPASTLACLLHVPLWSTSPAGLVNLGTTYRLRPREANREHVLLVDDTAHTGNAMRRYGPIVRRHWPQASLTKGVIYTTPAARSSVDVFAVHLPPPHYLQWHLFNSPYACAAMDFDGILSEDIAPGDDDDGPRYREALRTARPKYLVRYCAIPLVVTARLDRAKYRQLTLDWLARHGIRVDRLVMGPWKSLAERNRPGEVARFKARVYRESRLRLFIESCPDQARQIARDAHKPVLCPAAKLVFRP